MKKAAAFLSIITLAAALAWIAGVGVRKVQAQLTPVKSYQVWTHVEDTSGSSSDDYFARRSDGVEYIANSETGLKILRLVPSGISIYASDRISDITTRGNGKPYVAKDFAEDCSMTTLGNLVPGDKKTILGFKVLHFTRTIASSDGDKEETSLWAAPALNCHPLEQVDTYYSNGKVSRVDTTTATRALLGDPPADVFQKPAGTEVVPSKFFADLRGQPMNADAVKRIDGRYEQDKKAREAFGPF
jgi:hypothetical protein